jgi:hypothetical protein
MNPRFSYGAVDPASATLGFYGFGGGLWNGTGGITTITLKPSTGNFIAGSEFHLLGWE